MGSFVDEVNEISDVQDSGETFSELPETTVQAETTAAPTEVVQEEIPEKYKGKSATDIAKMHQEAERLIGRQGAEVGELRRIVDDFIKTQSHQYDSQEAQTEEIDYFTDPQRAVRNQIDSHPAIVQAQQAAVAMKQTEVQNRIKNAHPDYLEIAADPSFADWVQGSKVRLELFNRADQQFDYDSANELLSTWKERKELNKKMVEVSATDRKQQLKSATTSIAGGSDEGVGKKIYRRADIIKLMQTDPDRYDSMQDEIMQAYRDKRVK